MQFPNLKKNFKVNFIFESCIPADEYKRRTLELIELCANVYYSAEDRHAWLVEVRP